MPRTVKPESQYVLKVSLRGSRGIWRRIVMQGAQSLDDLHEEIFHAFGRHEEHLYSFYLPQPEARGRDRLRDAEEYSHPMAATGSGLDDDIGGGDARKARLQSLRLRAGQRFEYLFDFGDSWWHDILVEEVRPAGGDSSFLGVVEKRGRAPRQYPEELDE